MQIGCLTPGLYLFAMICVVANIICVPYLLNWVEFISVINVSYNYSDLYFTLSTYGGASNSFILHASEESSGVGKASGVSAAAPEGRRGDSRISF